MRYVQIEEAQAGMIAAKPIFDNIGKVLLSKGSVVTADYIERLMRRGMPGFYIEDEWSKDIEIEDVISPELRNAGIAALRNNNIDETLDIAKKMIEQILSSSVVSLDLMDLKSYDNYTYQHSVNVAIISTLVGMKMGLTKGNLQDLCIAAILHDVGKVLIDNDVLNKPGRLTNEEYTIVQRHSTLGYEIIKDRLDISATVKSAILMHHENEDGSGYPNGYKSGQIHLYAKIIHVADVFDALTSKRTYKPAYARSEAAEYLMGSCGTMFNKEVVEAFLLAVPIYPRGIRVLLSNHLDAIVVRNTKNTLRPVIRFENNEEIDMSDLTQNRSLTIVPSKKVIVR